VKEALIGEVPHLTKVGVQMLGDHIRTLNFVIGSTVLVSAALVEYGGVSERRSIHWRPTT
jgi:hypothetical protein